MPPLVGIRWRTPGAHAQCTHTWRWPSRPAATHRLVLLDPLVADVGGSNDVLVGPCVALWVVGGCVGGVRFIVFFCVCAGTGMAEGREEGGWALGRGAWATGGTKQGGEQMTTTCVSCGSGSSAPGPFDRRRGNMLCTRLPAPHSPQSSRVQAPHSPQSTQSMYCSTLPHVYRK